MIPNNRIQKKQAEDFVKEIDEESEIAFQNTIAQWQQHKVSGYDSSYQSLRDAVVQSFLDAENEKEYDLDLNVGLTLFEELNTNIGFNLVLASDDDIWRYLSCVVFPDLTYLRYPKPAKGDIRLNKKRFYSHTRRIWVKTLWWYVYLSWQGSKEETYKVLKDFGTDTISDFIERPGKGYRVNMFRELMKQYSGIDAKSSDLFNRIQKQNLVNCRTVEPALTENAEKGYVKSLFDQLDIVVNGETE